MHGTTLVLGGSGFLGSHVVAAAGTGVVFACRESGFVEATIGEGFHKLDALSEEEVERVLALVAPARVVLCTALSSVADAARYPVLAQALNVDFPRVVARWCARDGARLVHVSTDLVFGGERPREGGFREEDPPSPVSEYGRSKAAGEAAVLEACPHALVVRLSLLYGDSSGRARGASDSLLAAIEHGEKPALFTDEWRTPLEVKNAARALVELASLGESGVLHLAGPDRLSRYELGSAVLAARGLPADRIGMTTRAGAGMAALRPADVALDAARARVVLSTPLLSLREGLAAC